MSKKPRRGRVTPSWIFAGVLLVVFATILAVAGFASARTSNDAAGAHTPVGTDTVPESVRDGGPVVDAMHTPVTSKNLPPKTIALTFDDGPDPVWTPEILAVLKKYDVKATFFVVGSNVNRYPDLVKAIHESGSELGVHTFSHPDLVNVPRWRLDRELAETQLAIAGSAGITTYLLRPPYSSTAEAIDDLGYGTVLAAAQDGYVSVFTTDDGEDWQRPGVDAIVRNATPKPDAPAGSIVLLHDAGGERSETVAALDKYIPLMLQQGYRFTTVTGGMDMTPANTPATPRNQFMGSVLLGTLSVATTIVDVLLWVLFVVGVLVVLRLVLMVSMARRQAKIRRTPGWSWGPPVDWPVSVIVPAYNESKNIEATVRSILANDYPLEVVVVDDGSSDGTADLVEALGLPNVRVIRQANAGKPVALNNGVRAAAYELVIMIDGDTIFESETVRRLVQPFADPSIGAVAGNVKIANRDTLIGRLQHIEYVVGFNIDRRVQDALGSISTIPGAAGAFRRRALLDVGGLSTDTLAEDTDLTIALGRAGWRVVFEDRAYAWTEAPATASQLWRQRFRWSYGTMQAVWKHRKAVREDGSAGHLGRRGLAHVAAFHILLPLTAPLVDVFFVYGLLFEDPAITLLLWLGMLALQLAGALYAFHLEGEAKGALWVLPVQQIMYRQLMYLVLVQSVMSAVTGARVRWQQMHRVGVLGDMLPSMAAPGPPARVPTPQPAAAGPRPPVAVRAAPAPTAPAARTPLPPHERWLDVLVVVALAQIVAYHVRGTSWLSFAFPSMGVLFAVGGSLMVRSMRRTPAIDVIGHRLRWMLPPMWLLGVVLVPLMVWMGWANDTDEHVLRWQDLLFWVIPVLDPPSSVWGADVAGVLWYLRAFFWFVLLTPLMLSLFRRWPLRTALAPLLVVVLDSVLGWQLTDAGGFGSVLIDFGVFATCWMLGFAHREGTLRKMRLPVLCGLALLAVALGGAWTWYRSSGALADLNDMPLGMALFSAGVVLLLLRFSPRLAWLDRVPVLGRLVTIVTARAITIYLVHNIAIALAEPLADRMRWTSDWAVIGTAVGLTALATLAFGWVEDIAARRPPQLIPGGKRAAARRAPKRERGQGMPVLPPLPELEEELATTRMPAVAPRSQAPARRLPAPGRSPVDGEDAGRTVAIPTRRPIPEPRRAAPAPGARPAPPARHRSAAGPIPRPRTPARQYPGPVPPAPSGRHSVRTEDDARSVSGSER